MEINSNGLLGTRKFYKPFKYPFMFEAFKKSEQMHWTPEEVDFREDVHDWNNKLTASEKALVGEILKFFVQADVSVSEGYREVFAPLLGGHPECAMAMLSFAAREATHIWAYSTLIETLALPEKTYEAFLEYKEMRDKSDFLEAAKNNSGSPYEIAKALGVYSAFTEGMQLFSSFAVLLNFERHNKLKGFGNIIRWSIRDESLHVATMCSLFREFIDEHTYLLEPLNIGSSVVVSLPLELVGIARHMVSLEDKFIDLVFKDNAVEGITAEEVKGFIRFLANARYKQLGFKGTVFKGFEVDPLPWFSELTIAPEHANFFEAKSTEYSKGTVVTTEVKW